MRNLVLFVVIYLERDEMEDTKPMSLEINNLELIPHRYKEDSDLDGYLTIHARVVLSKKQYTDLGKLPSTVNVIRHGIDDEPRVMELDEIAWSRQGDEINEEICLRDRGDNEVSLFVSLDNSISLVVKQSIIIDELLNMLVSNHIIDKTQMNEIMAKVTDERIVEKQRELNELKDDLSEYDF